MCYLVRQHSVEAQQGSTPLPGGLDRVRPRWVAVGAALVGSIALAAFVAPAQSPTLPVAKDAAHVIPVAAKSGAAPVQPVVDQRTSGVDDGVPGATEVSKAGGAGCHHGL